MKASEIKRILGDTAPLFYQAKNLLLVDSDIHGESDLNRNVQIFKLDPQDYNLLDAVVHITGFDKYDNGCLSGSVFLNFSNKDGSSEELKIAEPCYRINIRNSKLSIFEVFQIIKDEWIDSFNQFKHEKYPNLNHTNDAEAPRGHGFSLNDSILSKFKLRPVAIATVLLIVFSSIYWLGSTNGQSKSEANNNQNLYQNTQNFDGVQDGRDLALKNLGIDQKAVEIDNSCFKAN